VLRAPLRSGELSSPQVIAEPGAGERDRVRCVRDDRDHDPRNCRRADCDEDSECLEDVG
jgi:hypothetical protein